MNLVLRNALAGRGTHALLSENERWHVVRTRPQQEAYAAQQLANQGFRTYLPRCLKNRRHARKFETVVVPLFPRYLFVIIDPTRDRWRSINGTYGVERLLMRAGTLEPVPCGVVEQLIDASDEESIIRFKNVLEPSQKVRVTAGPFADLLGQLEQLDESGRARVLLEVMGGRVLVTLAETSVAPAER